MEQMNDLCSQLAEMLAGSGKQEGEVCIVTRNRKDLQVTIANKPFNSHSHMFYFEAPDSNGNSLITGELVLLENEVSRTEKRLTDSGIIVSAIHNHWIYDNPKLIYFHLEANINALNFVRILAPIINDLQ